VNFRGRILLPFSFRYLSPLSSTFHLRKTLIFTRRASSFFLGLSRFSLRQSSLLAKDSRFFFKIDMPLRVLFFFFLALGLSLKFTFSGAYFGFPRLSFTLLHPCGLISNGVIHLWGVLIVLAAASQGLFSLPIQSFSSFLAQIHHFGGGS